MISFLKSYLFVCFCLLFSLGKAEQAYIKSLKKTSSLPKSKIFTVKQGKNGFIWVATESGLYSFDGYEYEEHAFLGNDEGIRLNPVKDIHFDQYGKMQLMFSFILSMANKAIASMI